MTSAQTRSNRKSTKLRRVGNDALAFASDIYDINGLEVFTNAEQFEAIKDHAVLLYYTETEADVIFDPENDAVLVNLLSHPFAFSNDQSLLNFISLITRACFYCKPHPDQSALRAQAEGDLGMEMPDLLILVYKRDNAHTSVVKNRRDTPFRNAVNGLGTSDSGESALVALFRQYEHTPFASVAIVWHREPRLCSTVGMIGVRIEKFFAVTGKESL